MQVVTHHSSEPLPWDGAAQRLLEREWLRVVRDRADPRGLRSVIRASWDRALVTHVAPDLTVAPLVLDLERLHAAQEQEDWLAPAQEAVRRHPTSFSGPGHILALFDRDGRMLASDGDQAALDGLAEINFRPGGHWAESVVGTNGPGTALETGRPTHVIGAEHFCAGWQGWHCAAVPIRDPATEDILGVLDISGFRERAHPHSMDLALALVVAIEHALAAREAARQCLTIAHFADLRSRYPGTDALAVSRHGRVLGMSAGVPVSVRQFAEGSEFRRLIAGMGGVGAGGEVALATGRGTERAVWSPVYDGSRLVGGCVLLDAPPPLHRKEISGGSGQVRRGNTRYTFDDLVGTSPALVEARAQGEAAARTDLPVLLLGESGTGKEVFAQAIHEASARSRRSFIAVNCAAIPRELVESEMFGYAAGAFTGARREGGQGRFEAADGGTLFLDEIAELSPSAQAALLRVLEEGEIVRVGSAHSRPVDVRIVAATNRPIEQALSDGTFRHDLYHRLNVLPIELPPLRDRPEDIVPLMTEFLRAAARSLGRSEPVMTPDAIAALRAYPWPGNVREIKNLMRRLAAISRGMIGVADLPASVRRGRSAALNAAAQPAAQEARSSPLDAEDAALMRAVAGSRTMAEAAARLGITRSTLYRRMERYGLKPQRVIGRT